MIPWNLRIPGKKLRKLGKDLDDISGSGSCQKLPKIPKLNFLLEIEVDKCWKFSSLPSLLVKWKYPEQNNLRCIQESGLDSKRMLALRSSEIAFKKWIILLPHYLTLCTVRWTHGRQGASWKRMWGAVGTADTFIPSWLAQQLQQQT